MQDLVACCYIYHPCCVVKHCMGGFFFANVLLFLRLVYNLYINVYAQTYSYSSTFIGLCNTFGARPIVTAWRKPRLGCVIGRKA